MSKILLKLYSWFPFRPEDGILPVPKSITFFLNHSSKGRQLCTAPSAHSHQLWHEGLSPLVWPTDHVGDPPLVTVMLYSVIPIPCLSLPLVLSLPFCFFFSRERRCKRLEINQAPQKILLAQQLLGFGSKLLSKGAGSGSSIPRILPQQIWQRKKDAFKGGRGRNM